MGNSQFTPPFTQQQIRALVIIAKITAVPSLLVCPLLAQHVVRSKKRLRTSYHRLLLGMTTHDFLFALNQFIGTWANPSEYKSFMWLAAGSWETCTAAGFLRQGSLLTSILYSAGLTLFFLLVVSYGWTEHRIQRRVEPWIHIIAIGLGWGTAIYALLQNLYAPFAWGCGIVAWPPGCTQSYQATEGENGNCERGDNAGIYSWAFLMAWVWLTLLFITVSMSIIYLGILKKEKRLEQYSFELRPSSRISNQQIKGSPGHTVDGDGSSAVFCQVSLQQGPEESEEVAATSSEIQTTATNNYRHSRETTATNKYRHSREFAKQALLYCLFFFFVFIFGCVNIVLVNFGPEKPYMPLMIPQTLLGPLAGFFNVLVYVRPRYASHKRRHPDDSFWRIMNALFSLGNKSRGLSSLQVHNGVLELSVARRDGSGVEGGQSETASRVLEEDYLT